MHLVHKGEGVVAVGHVQHFPQGADGPSHGVDRLEGHDLGVGGVVFPEELLQVGGVVVTEHFLLGPRVDHPHHHGVMVALV